MYMITVSGTIREQVSFLAHIDALGGLGVLVVEVI